MDTTRVLIVGAGGDGNRLAAALVNGDVYSTEVLGDVESAVVRIRHAPHPDAAVLSVYEGTASIDGLTSLRQAGPALKILALLPETGTEAMSLEKLLRAGADVCVSRSNIRRQIDALLHQSGTAAAAYL